MHQALRVYDIFIERDIPWKKLQKYLDNLETFRSDLSTEKAIHIADIKMAMMNAIDAHFHTSQKVYEFTRSTGLELKLYMALFKNHDVQKSDMQKQILTAMLDGTITRMSLALIELGQVSTDFNLADNGLKVIRRKNQSSKKITRRFFEKLAKSMKSAIELITYEKQVLSKQIERISSLKSQIQEMEPFVNLDENPNLRDMVMRSARSLFTECEEYQQRHTDNNELRVTF